MFSPAYSTCLISNPSGTIIPSFKSVIINAVSFIFSFLDSKITSAVVSGWAVVSAAAVVSVAASPFTVWIIYFLTVPSSAVTIIFVVFLPGSIFKNACGIDIFAFASSFSAVIASFTTSEGMVRLYSNTSFENAGDKVIGVAVLSASTCETESFVR